MTYIVVVVAPTVAPVVVTVVVVIALEHDSEVDVTAAVKYEVEKLVSVCGGCPLQEQSMSSMNS